MKTVVAARNPMIAAIFENLDRRRWVSRDELLEMVGKHIPTKVALVTYEKRINQGEGKKTQIARGKAMYLLLACITLVQHGKLEQTGRGESKKYRRLV